MTPTVTVIVAAWNEEAVIARRLENLLALDYPADRLEIVVASDASDDGTDAIVEEFAAREPRVRLLRCPRGGKVAAQNRAVARVAGRRRRLLGRQLHLGARCAAPARPRRSPTRSVAYACGRLVLQEADGTNVEGAYWRLETWLREQEAATGSITGGNGSIYAVRRADYVDVDPRFGHDLSFPYLMVQHGRRAAYEPGALAFEKPSRDIEDEYARKVRMFEHCWAIVVEGDMLRGLPPGLPGKDRLAPPSALRQRHRAPRAARVEPRACPARRRLPCRAPRPARLSGRGGRASRLASLLHARHVGDREGASELPPRGRAGRVGEGRGHQMTLQHCVARKDRAS